MITRLPQSLSHHDLTEVLGSYYGVPCYPSLADLLAAHPLTADYLPRRQRRLATSPALRPPTPALPAPVNWLLARRQSPDNQAGSQVTRAERPAPTTRGS